MDIIQPLMDMAHEAIVAPPALKGREIYLILFGQDFEGF